MAVFSKWIWWYIVIILTLQYRSVSSYDGLSRFFTNGKLTIHHSVHAHTSQYVPVTSTAYAAHRKTYDVLGRHEGTTCGYATERTTNTYYEFVSNSKEDIPINPNVAFFAGQGFQHIGMGKETVNTTPAAASLYRRASKVLGYDLLDVVMNGSPGVLQHTNVTQPAMLVASLAAVERYRKDEGQLGIDDFGVVVGFSIGEYAALVFAGVISFEDGVRLTQLRGQAMQDAAQLSEQGMSTVDGLSTDELSELCRRITEKAGEKIWIANFLASTLNVVSGSKSSCDRLAEEIRLRGEKRVRIRKLSVSGAFHSPYMRPAVAALAEALQNVHFETPKRPIVFNVDAKVHFKTCEIRKLIALQVSSPVRMEDSIKYILANGVRRGVEFGPNSGLGKIMQRVTRSVDDVVASDVSVSNVL